MFTKAKDRSFLIQTFLIVSVIFPKPYLRCSMLKLLLSSRLYCRYWNFTKSASFHTRSRTITAGRELHPAPKNFLIISFTSTVYRTLLLLSIYLLSKIMLNWILLFGISTLNTLTSTTSPTFTTSRGCFT